MVSSCLEDRKRGNSKRGVSIWPSREGFWENFHKSLSGGTRYSESRNPYNEEERDPISRHSVTSLGTVPKKSWDIAVWGQSWGNTVLGQCSLGAVLDQSSLGTKQSWAIGLGTLVLGRWSWAISLGTLVLGRWSWAIGLGTLVLGRWSWDVGLGLYLPIEETSA